MNLMKIVVVQHYFQFKLKIKLLLVILAIQEHCLLILMKIKDNIIN